MQPKPAKQRSPFDAFEPWEEHVRSRYQPERQKEEFRVFNESAPPVVIDFYRQNHTQQTLAFVLGKKKEYCRLDKTRMGIWEAMEALDRIVDDSDPDTDLTQIQHCLQTAEAIRTAGKPDWFVLTGLIHDLGKVLALWGEPQWAVVGDTFPVGCPWSEKIVYHEFFRDNPDREVAEFQEPYGIYHPGVGLNHVHLSWGHDEYLYLVVRDYLPDEALAMIRFHSFYPWHREGAYTALMDEKDRRLLHWVQDFNPFDLYTKSSEKPDVSRLKPYYLDLIRKYFPDKVRW
jgi:inositol oxygenase